MKTATPHLRPSGKVFVACGFWLVALGAYFLFLRPAVLPVVLGSDCRWLLSPMIAALAMSLSSVSVISNALRLT